MFEDTILTRVSINAALDALPPMERDIMAMLFAYDQPDDYDGPWPPTLGQVGEYIGAKYRHPKPLSEGRVAKLRDAVLARWRADVDE